ncbi:hypothetical protein AZE42_08676, partial [Rhizopogon vesiculosus]
MTNRIAEV